MKYRLIVVQSKREEWHKLATETYLQKLKAFHDFEITSIKSSRQGRDDSASKKADESKAILCAIKEGEWIVLLDERGQSFDSVAFAKTLQKWQDTGKNKICFVIGGAFGVTEELAKRAHFKISLSPMVMNHLLAQVVLLEQVYRSFCIHKNIPYHNI